MPKANPEACRRLLRPLLCMGVAAPLGAFADGGDYPHANPALAPVFFSIAILLAGALFLLLRMRRNLSKKNRALETCSQRFRTMGDNLPNVTVFQLACLPGGRFSFEYLSKGLEHTLGIDRDRMMKDAKLAFEHLYEADIPALKAAYREARETLVPANLVVRVLDVSGHLRWLRISAVPHRENGTLAWDGFVQDITESKNTEAALLEESHNFQNLFETIDDLLLVCDLKGNLLHTNRAVGKRLGYTHGELDGMSLFDLYPGPLRTEAYQVVTLMQTEKTTTCNLPLRRKNGESIPVEMNIFQGVWKNKKAIFGVVRDMANRQQTENALHESQKMLQLIMNTIPLSVFWKDKDSVYLGCNPAFAKECGLATVDDVVGKTPFDLFDAETAKTLVDRDQHMITTNQPLFNVLQSHPRSDDSIGWRETSKIPLRDEEGCATGILGVWRNATEQTRAEERLKRTLEDMDRFNQLMRGRERRTLELKGEINHLLEELGREAKYQTATDKQA